MEEWKFGKKNVSRKLAVGFTFRLLLRGIENPSEDHKRRKCVNTAVSSATRRQLIDGKDRFSGKEWEWAAKRWPALANMRGFPWNPPGIGTASAQLSRLSASAFGHPLEVTIDELRQAWLHAIERERQLTAEVEHWKAKYLEARFELDAREAKPRTQSKS